MLWVYDHTGSLLVAMLMHASLDAATFIIGPTVISGPALLVYDAVLSAAWWLVVAVVILADRGRLAPRPVEEVQRARPGSKRAAPNRYASSRPKCLTTDC
jgi:hypothetical protein